MAQKAYTAGHTVPKRKVQVVQLDKQYSMILRRFDTGIDSAIAVHKYAACVLCCKCLYFCETCVSLLPSVFLANAALAYCRINSMLESCMSCLATFLHISHSKSSMQYARLTSIIRIAATQQNVGRSRMLHHSMTCVASYLLNTPSILFRRIIVDSHLSPSFIGISSKRPVKSAYCSELYDPNSPRPFPASWDSTTLQTRRAE